ncbi:MAG: biopolymer transporter ExbD [Verrucomicrobia bacterium]|nr:biopolymer transporter ExbD [Verrucomicrobiota bacterium]
MASGGGGTESGEPEFQIAPMIDVLLVLLIFFMSITTAEILKIDKNITLPVSPNAIKRDAKMTRHEIAINVRWDPKQAKAFLKVDDRDYPNITELIPILQKKAKEDELARAVIRGDRALPAIEIQKIMTLIGEGGISDISFAASNK